MPDFHCPRCGLNFSEDDAVRTNVTTDRSEYWGMPAYHTTYEPACPECGYKDLEDFDEDEHCLYTSQT